MKATATINGISINELSDIEINQKVFDYVKWVDKLVEKTFEDERVKKYLETGDLSYIEPVRKPRDIFHKNFSVRK